ncbi:hypothetical protein M0R45_026757 [Rubus argutus]|uniref:NAC domain-containing protein n=1 Tax=Rubus argutus TaxID=59490 RepID=A0AAW1WZ25_RUBAR
MEGYPVGFRFHPLDEELVGYYLYNRSVLGHQFRPLFFAECPDFYGESEPWVIWESYGGPKLEDGEPLHLFTERHKLNPKGKHFARKVGSGTWSAQYARHVVEDSVLLGVKREFRYEGGVCSNQNNAWLMQEYEITENDFTVLCTLRKNPKRPPGPSPPTSTITSTSHRRRNVQKKTSTSTVDDNKRKRNPTLVHIVETTVDGDDNGKAKRLRIEQPAASTTGKAVLSFSGDYSMHFPGNQESNNGGGVMLFSNSQNPDDIAVYDGYQNADDSSQLQPSTIADYSAEQSSTGNFSSLNDDKLGGASEDIFSSLPGIIDHNVFDNVTDLVHYADADSSSQTRKQSSSSSSASHYDDQGDIYNCHEQQLIFSPTGLFDNNPIDFFDQFLASGEEQQQEEQQQYSDWLINYTVNQFF